MDAKESAEHAAAAAAQYKEAQTPTEAKTATSPKRDRTASLDDVDDAKPIADYRARGVCKAALGKSFLFGRRWTPGTYAVDVDRSHIVRFEDDAAGTCWEDTPTNRYAFAGDCDVKESGDTWDAVLELSRVADLLAKDAKPTSLALKFPTSTRRDQFRRAIDEARRRDPAAEALQHEDEDDADAPVLHLGMPHDIILIPPCQRNSGGLVPGFIDADFETNYSVLIFNSIFRDI